MEHNKKVLRGFFTCMGIGFLISCIKTNYKNMDSMEILSTLFLTFMFNLMIGIWAGLTSIFWNLGSNLGKEIFISIKKKERNERYWDLYRLI